MMRTITSTRTTTIHACPPNITCLCLLQRSASPLGVLYNYDGMQLDWAMMAEAVQVRDGLAYVLGGGFDTVVSGQLPAALHGAVVIRLLLHRTEADRQHAVEIRVLDEDGAELLRLHGHFQARIPADLPLGWDIPLLVSFAIPNLPLADEGRYSVEILGDGSHLKSLNLRVRVLTTASAPS
jgi:hypothetical protein